MVGVLAINSDGPSSNPAEVYSLFSVKLRENNEKESGDGPLTQLPSLYFDSRWGKLLKNKFVGSGYGSAVGREVASDTRDPRFESRHWQIFILQNI